MQHEHVQRPKGIVAAAVIVLTLLGVASVASANWSPGRPPVAQIRPERYVVQPGDNLSSIVVRRFGPGHRELVDQLAQAHGSWSVQIGDVLWLPSVV
jgi:hypothetical protein